MLHPITSTGAAAARRTLLTTMPYRLRSTCPRGTRIATIRNASKKTATTAPAMAMTTPTSTRLFHHSRTLLGSTKEDHMDRERLNPSSTEYSKSGSDDDAAKMGDAAFNPDKTSPEAALGSAEQESGEVRQDQEQSQPQSSSSSQGANPLDVSPGNPGVSESKDPQQGGPDRSPSESGEASSRARTSSRVSPKKHGDGKTG
ncbi:uncharacterized protein BKCO1_1000047 [Diplodia corticola]|uniref:Uncharacterized protein n=1 Tax=Diplodia corticola TaxID=236234 RepID=A0A1J9S7X1_9PEZI|nr:uncharacterized protein BKCO1_1000047 [Diplodia corticola]OJD36591.1 hypothetical protein BKCO1_1000047 [Diplodia corticola]